MTTENSNEKTVPLGVKSEADDKYSPCQCCGELIETTSLRFVPCLDDGQIRVERWCDKCAAETKHN